MRQARLAFDVVVDEPKARSNDPVTSHEAAKSVKERAALRARILAILRTLGPLTHEEIIARVREVSLANDGKRFSDSGIRTRTSELVRSLDVEESGTFATLASGRRSIRWRARHCGQEYAAPHHAAEITGERNEQTD